MQRNLLFGLIALLTVVSLTKLSAQAQPAMDYSGAYTFTAYEYGQQVDSGTLVITQSHGNVTAVATGSEGLDTLTGTVTGSTMPLTRGDEDPITVVMEFSSDGSIFSGTFSSGGEGGSGTVTGMEIGDEDDHHDGDGDDDGDDDGDADDDEDNQPSCPDLYSWDGEKWQNNGFIFARSHCPEAESYQELSVSEPVVAQGNRLIFKIKELDGEISYINSVAMYYQYKPYGGDEWTELGLLSAIHNRGGDVSEALVGDVSEALKEKDDERVNTIPGDEILLTYELPVRGLEYAKFVCVSSGYYLWTDEIWCQVLKVGSELDVQPGDTFTLMARINNTSTKGLPENAMVWFDVEGSDWSGSKVASVSVAGLAPGTARWYSCDWSLPGDAAAGTYTYEASVWIGESDITLNPDDEDLTVKSGNQLGQPASLSLSEKGESRCD